MADAINASLAQAIHYPDCWDVAAYPTVQAALSEVYAAFRCTTCGEKAPMGEGEREAFEDALGDFDHMLAQWGKAYPLSTFPEPDWGVAQKALEAAGVTLDAVSASNMRHVVTALNTEFNKVRALLNKAAS